MSQKREIVSEEAQGEQGPASVFDFLYNDSRRIGSYLAQLDENGLLTEIRQGEQAVEGSTRGVSVSGEALGFGGGFEITPGEGRTETSERVYDPFWANARELLDALKDRGMIRRDVSSAPIGSVVLLSGSMSLVDLSLIRDLWELPSMRELMTRGIMPLPEPVPEPALNRQTRRAQGIRPSPPPTPSLPVEMALMLEMLPVLPHSLNAIMSGVDGESWANLKEEFLIGSGSDLILKHGIVIPGEWNMLGILDAQPDAGGQADIEANSLINFADPTRLETHSLVGQMASVMSPIFRILLGRPGTHYGVTPLLIFREVGHTGI